jgi:hypothetical protein
MKKRNMGTKRLSAALSLALLCVLGLAATARADTPFGGDR